MRWEYWHYGFWLLIAGSWVLGVIYGKWGGGNTGIFADIGQAVSVPSPERLTLWQPIFYFTLTILASFVLSQIFFGAGAAIFIFARGVNDAILFTSIETMVQQLNFPNLESRYLWMIFFIGIVLVVNLPICLWAAHLGTQRAVQLLYRLRRKPFKPEGGKLPLSELLMLLAISMVVGLIATFVLFYALSLPLVVPILSNLS